METSESASAPTLHYDSLLLHELNSLALAASRPSNDSREDVLARLDVLLTPGQGQAGNAFQLEEALNIIENGRVCRVCAHPSGRVTWQVGSMSFTSRRGSNAGGGVDLEASGLTAALDGGGSTQAYTVLLDGPGLCTCLSFSEQLPQLAGSGGSSRLCRHLLAAHIANAVLGTPSGTRVRQKDIADVDLCRVLSKAVGCLSASSSV
jgi:hypothetical protein